MLQKKPVPRSGRLVKFGLALVGLELGAFIGSWVIWHRLNISRDSRYYAYANYNWALNTFYSLGELADGNYKLREADLQAWKREGKI